MAALTVSAVKPSETISFSQRTRATSSGILHAGSGSHHFSSASFEAEAKDARDFSRGRFTNTKTQEKKENGKKKSNTYKTPDDDAEAKKGTSDEPDKHGTDESGKHGTPSYNTGKKPSSGISSDKGQTPGTHANSQIRTGDETRIEIYVILFASAGLLLILAGRMLKKE